MALSRGDTREEEDELLVELVGLLQRSHMARVGNHDQPPLRKSRGDGLRLEWRRQLVVLPHQHESGHGISATVSRESGRAPSA